MAIIALTMSLSPVLRGDRGPCPPCPTNADPVLVRNGTYTRPVQDGRGIYVLTIQRYRCRTCAVTYSALPYDCRPCTAHTWAVGWLWPQAYHWTWKRCHQWLAAHQIDGGRPIRPVKIRQQEVSRTPLIRHRREQLGTVLTPSYKGHEFFPFLGSELTLSVMITRVQPVAGLRGAAVRPPRSTDRLSAFLADDRNLPEY